MKTIKSLRIYISTFVVLVPLIGNTIISIICLLAEAENGHWSLLSEKGMNISLKSEILEI